MQNGIWDLAAGGVLIAIGVSYGGSVFTGDPTLFDWFFDLLGSFWVGRGLFRIVSSRQSDPTPSRDAGI